MAILNTGLVKPSASGYSIDNSCRFNDDDSAYMARTPAGAGNRKTWTLSFWIKRSAIESALAYDWFIFSSTNYFRIGFKGDSSIIDHFIIRSSTESVDLTTSQKFRDAGGWYHIVIAFDTTESTESDRVKLYVNGTQVTAFSTADYPGEDTDNDWNDSSVHEIGRSASFAGRYYDGYLSEVHNIDGTALDPTSFGERGDYGEWKPIEYTGSYGTNGFYLDFADAADLGDDESGNGNDFTETNLTESDQMLDTPTNNFSTWNPLTKGSYVTFSEGNLRTDGNTTDSGNVRSTFHMTTGKWYMEVLCQDVSASFAYPWIGCIGDSAQIGIPTNGGTGQIGQVTTNSCAYLNSGTMYLNGSSSSSWGDTFTDDDIIGMAIDADNGALYFAKNNTWQNSGNPASGASKTGAAFTWTGGSITLAFALSDYDATTVANFGQDGSFAGEKTSQGNADGNGYGNFYYAPPSSHLALCSKNLPEPTVVPSENFNIVLYTGDGSSENAITGVGFQPDFLWQKRYDSGGWHFTTDVFREPNGMSTSESNADTGSAYFTSLDADGFTVGTPGNFSGLNTNTATAVAWCWKAGGAGSANTDGDMAETVTVSANQNAGFSIVKYTGDGSAATVGHGLSAAPELIIVKNTDQADAWQVYHAGNTSAPETDYMVLNTDAATSDAADRWNDTAPTSSVFTIGDAVEVNTDDEIYIAYCFHSVDGFSKIGTYEGNGSANGSFVYTGFAPAYVLRKRNGSTSNWLIQDTARSPYNLANTRLYADTTAGSVANENEIDFVSNGFKLRATDTFGNASGATYLYMAFSETPFKNAQAR